MVVDHDVQPCRINHRVFLLFPTSLSHSIPPPLCGIHTKPSRQTCGERKNGWDEEPFPIFSRLINCGPAKSPTLETERGENLEFRTPGHLDGIIDTWGALAVLPKPSSAITTRPRRSSTSWLCKRRGQRSKESLEASPTYNTKT